MKGEPPSLTGGPELLNLTAMPLEEMNHLALQESSSKPGDLVSARHLGEADRGPLPPPRWPGVLPCGYDKGPASRSCPGCGLKSRGWNSSSPVFHPQPLGSAVRSQVWGEPQGLSQRRPRQPLAPLPRHFLLFMFLIFLPESLRVRC